MRVNFRAAYDVLSRHGWLDATLPDVGSYWTHDTAFAAVDRFESRTQAKERGCSGAVEFLRRRGLLDKAKLVLDGSRPVTMPAPPPWARHCAACGVACDVGQGAFIAGRQICHREACQDAAKEAYRLGKTIREVLGDNS